MVKVGLVVETGFRRAGRRTEAVYDVVAERFEFNTDVAPESLLKLMRSLHRRTERNFEKSLDAGIVDFSARSRNAYIRGETARLSSKELRRVKKLLVGNHGHLRRGEKERNGNVVLARIRPDANSPTCGRVTHYRRAPVFNEISPGQGSIEITTLIL